MTEVEKVDDDRFGTVWIPKSFDELIALTVDAEGGINSVRMWRGQADQSWLLHSGIYRKLMRVKPPVAEQSVSSHEKQLLRAATHRGYRRVEGRNLTDFELLARLQHHGAATRLVDTTRSMLIGLYFACSEQFDRDGMLFGIHTWHLGGGEGGALTEPYDVHVKSLAKFDYPQTWEPPAVSSRVAAQHSQFVYSKIVADQTHGSLALADAVKWLLAIRIPASDKKRYLGILQGAFDIHPLTLFPDLDGFGHAFGWSRGPYDNSRW
ncbi:FRG domain-containing protein [Sphingobium phenoxybenzoativorans]|uniref:FRG domain-containing protein n=1 Tax=Sphingobium phenoxybenzoativorans TaxID=1592790 RepID=UPI000871E533|nr:FRG domain-containing protein [Sphingobium phenoxybenzoativorans]